MTTNNPKTTWWAEHDTAIAARRIRAEIRRPCGCGLEASNIILDEVLDRAISKKSIIAARIQSIQYALNGAYKWRCSHDRQ